MKTAFMTTLLVFATANLFSQKSLPDIPFKNDLVYYSFTEKFDNLKYDLSHYNSETYRFQNKLSSKLKAFNKNTENEKNFFSMGSSTDMNVSFNLSNEWKDYTFQYDFSKKYGYTSALFELVGTKVGRQKITASVKIEYNKNQYTLKFRDFVYEYTYTPPFQSTKTEFRPLGEVYLEIKNGGKPKPSQIELFNDLNFVISELNKMVKEAFNEAIKLSELD